MARECAAPTNNYQQCVHFQIGKETRTLQKHFIFVMQIERNQMQIDEIEWEISHFNLFEYVSPSAQNQWNRNAM